MAAIASPIDLSASYGGLRAFVASRVRAASDAEDVVHLVLERAIVKAPNADVGNVTAWLYGIARNAIADYYREQARRSLAVAEAMELDEAPLSATDSERTYVLACMEPLLAVIAEEDAALLRWADMQGRSMQSIADELGISLSATKSRVQRARKEFVKATRACCAIGKDARGRVTSLTPHIKPKAEECVCTTVPDSKKECS